MTGTKRLLLVYSVMGLAACEGPAEEAVRAASLDPAATEFQDVGRCEKDRGIVTGKFNAKNAFGAYVGFQSFYWSADGGLVLHEHPKFSEMIDRCYGPLVIDPNDKAAAEAGRALKELDRANRMLEEAKRKAAREVGQ